MTTSYNKKKHGIINASTQGNLIRAIETKYNIIKIQEQEASMSYHHTRVETI